MALTRWRPASLRTFSLAACTSVLGLLAGLPVAAQTFEDAALEALYLADKPAALQAASAQRVAAAPGDAQAVLGLALAALQRDDASARRDAVDKAQACIAVQPKAAACQYALGVVLGIQAMSEGLFAAARSVATVRAALNTAHELLPDWYPARSALLEFYLAAPALMGGSTSRAAELARSAPRAGQVQALQARIALAERRFEPALRGIMALPEALEPALASDVHAWGVQAAIGTINAGQGAQALPWLERARRARPNDAGAAYALGRARAEAGDGLAALQMYEQATRLKGADDWPLLYRIGQLHQQAGRPDEARTAYRRFLAAGKGPRQAIDDAKARLAQLGG